ncbi:MAG TPA: YhjD/YihY/BrkB family envelope integrity protein [Thermoanaerobaculia bacterium]|jgi:membrane protein|nr:YhjD/YihY/BrkB family envelope integrity protein [Thermoanaerobaculia bacterium]
MSERRLAAKGVVRESVRNWLRHDAPTQSAALAFYTLVSLAPVLALLLSIAGAFLGEAAVRERIADEVRRELHTTLPLGEAKA